MTKVEQSVENHYYMPNDRHDTGKYCGGCGKTSDEHVQPPTPKHYESYWPGPSEGDEWIQYE